MEVIKDTIKNIMQDWAEKKAAFKKENPERWLNAVFTKKAKGHIRFNYFKKGVLAVSVDSSSWLYNLTLQKEALLKKLRLKASAAKDIRFRLGEFNPIRKTISNGTRLSNGVK